MNDIYLTIAQVSRDHLTVNLYILEQCQCYTKKTSSLQRHFNVHLRK